ncbi:MAG: terminase gpA endonuclease subunit [Aurantimonas coralicida]
MPDMIEIEDAAKDPALIREARRLARLGEVAFFRSLAELSEALIANEPEDIPEWCAKNLFVPAEKSTRGGPMVLTPIQAAISRFWQDPFISQVTFLKPPRIGSSFLNAAGMLYYGCHESSDTIFYERSEGAAQDFHNDRLMPVFENSISIAHLIRKATKSGIQDRWTDKMLMNGAGMKHRSAENNGSFRAIRGRFIIADEAGDKAYRASGKNSEGSKVDLIKRRGQEFADFTLYLGGTPTRAGECTVSEEFEKSDKRDFVMTATCCGHRQAFLPDVRRAKDETTPYGPGLRYLTDDRGVPIPGKVWYECAGCGHHIPETEKVPMMETGVFEATTIGDRGHVGVFVWAAHSTDPKSRWIDIADAHARSEKDLSLQQTFTNVWLARPWEEPIQRDADPSELENRAEKFPDGIDCPEWTEYLFSGVDLQEGNLHRPDKPPRVEIVTYAAGRNRRRFVIDRTVISHYDMYDHISGETVRMPCEPMSPMSCQLIEEYLDRDWVGADGQIHKIHSMFVDSGWRNSEVLDFCNLPKNRRRGVKAIRGAREFSGRRPVIPNKESFSQRLKRPYLFLGTQSAKDTLSRTMKIPTPAPESWGFSAKFGRDFYESLLAEHQVKLDNGSTMWRRISAEETGEVWDCLVYAYAAECYARQNSRKVDAAIARLDALALEEAMSRQAETQAEAAEPKIRTATEKNSGHPVKRGQDVPQTPADTTAPATGEPPRFRLKVLDPGKTRDAGAAVPAARGKTRSTGPVARAEGIW